MTISRTTRAVLALAASALLLPLTASAAGAHNPPNSSYQYTTAMAVCLDAAGGAGNCATSSTSATNSPAFNIAATGASAKVTVDFDLTTNNTGEIWTVPTAQSPGPLWESFKKFRVAFVANLNFNCYTSRVAQNSPLNPGLSSPAEPVVGGMLLPLSTTISNGKSPKGTVTGGYTVTSDSSGAFLVSAQLPTLPAESLFAGNAKVCVESELLYGGEGGLGVDGNNDGDFADPGEVHSGAGLHCGDYVIDGTDPCTDLPEPLDNYNPNCTNCYEYNSTPRIQVERVIAIA